MASREAQPTDYRGRFKELQALELEARKDGLIEELLTRLDDLKAQRDEAKSDLETEREARRRLQRTLRDSHPNRQRFALLIIHLDADHFLFDDSWMREPASGGEKIADVLVTKTNSYLQDVLDDSTNIQVIVKIYGDLFKLWRTYEGAGVELGSMDLTRFFSHFNRNNALIDFVDIGPRKASIERKLSGVLSHYLQDDRVEHILLASPHQAIPPILAPLDAHLSAPLASPNSSNDNSSRLTLITAPPTPNDWSDLGYRTTAHFESLFMPVPPAATTPTPPPPPRSPLAKKVHHKERAPPQAPQPPPAANVNKVRIRKDAWREREARSPHRDMRRDSGGFLPQMSGANGSGGGRAMFAPMQLARRETYPQRYAGVPPEAPSIPSIHWP